jgi:hypothetical protein
VRALICCACQRDDFVQAGYAERLHDSFTKSTAKLVSESSAKGRMKKPMMLNMKMVLAGGDAQAGT